MNEKEEIVYCVDLVKGGFMEIAASNIKSITSREFEGASCFKVEIANGQFVFAKRLKQITKLVEQDESILFRGQEYPVYIVRMFAGTPREHFVRISTTELCDAIVADGSEGSTLDNEFTYYIDKDDLKKSDETIAYMILRQCYELELYEAVFGCEYDRIGEFNKPDKLSLNLFIGTNFEHKYYAARISYLYRQWDNGVTPQERDIFYIDDGVYDKMNLMELIDYVEKWAIERYHIVLD